MKIDVAISTDDNYAKYCATTICSVLANKNDNDDIVFHVLYGDLTQENIAKLSAISGAILHKVNNGEFSPYVRDCKLTWATPTLYRLKLASILKDVKKVIYLDCDIIVRSSLGELFQTDISNYVLAGVPDTSHQNHLKRLNLPNGEGNFYFNAGMVFMNLEKMRQEGYEEKLFTFLRKHWQELSFSDQDVLNVVLFGKTFELPKKFNFIPLARFHSKEFCDTLPKDIVIIHYAGVKPWEKGFFNPLEGEFWHYYKKSAFLPEAEFEKLFKNYKKSRTKLSQTLLYLKRYPFAIFNSRKAKELFEIIFS